MHKHDASFMCWMIRILILPFDLGRHDASVPSWILRSQWYFAVAAVYKRTLTKRARHWDLPLFTIWLAVLPAVAFVVINDVAICAPPTIFTRATSLHPFTWLACATEVSCTSDACDFTCSRMARNLLKLRQTHIAFLHFLSSPTKHHKHFTGGVSFRRKLW